MWKGLAMVWTSMEKAEPAGVQSPVSHTPVVASNEGQVGGGANIKKRLAMVGFTPM
jgi:hypothetical protein